MKSFRQYITELWLDQKYDMVKSEFLSVTRWFAGYWMDNPMNQSDEKHLITQLGVLSKLTDDRKPSNNPLYRIFAEDDLSKYLSSDQQREYADLDTTRKKLNYLNRAFDGKTISLNTSNKNVQSWTISEDDAVHFHETIGFHQNQHSIYVIVASSFDYPEKLIGIDQFKILAHMDTNDLEDQAKEKNINIVDAAIFQDMCQQIYERFEDQHEIVVDTRLPRPVEIVNVIGPDRKFK